MNVALDPIVNAVLDPIANVVVDPIVNAVLDPIVNEAVVLDPTCEPIIHVPDIDPTRKLTNVHMFVFGVTVGALGMILASKYIK